MRSRRPTGERGVSRGFRRRLAVTGDRRLGGLAGRESAGDVEQAIGGRAPRDVRARFGCQCAGLREIGDLARLPSMTENRAVLARLVQERECFPSGEYIG